MSYTKGDDLTTTSWFPVSLVTSDCRANENLKRAKFDSKRAKINFKSNFHLATRSTPKKKTSKIPKLVPSVKNQYKLRQRKIDTYVNNSFNQNIRNAIQLSVKDKVTTVAELTSILEQRHLKAIDVPGDGNCFFYSVALMMYGTTSKAYEIREQAAEEISNRPADFKDFIDGNTLEDIVNSISTDREWADHVAIQATCEALQISIEILNSNPAKYGTTYIRPRNGRRPKRHLIVGQIEQVHYVATEPLFPIVPQQWGGFANGWRLNNTCSVDGSLFWLMCTLSFNEKFLKFIEDQELIDLISIYKKFTEDNASEGKFEWFRNFMDGNVYKHHDRIDFHGSEARNFFEPLSQTPLAQFNLVKKCLISCKPEKYVKKMLRVPNNRIDLASRIRNSFETSTSSCPSCNNEMTTEIVSIPPIFFISVDSLNSHDRIPKTFRVEALGAVIQFVLVLITLKSLESKNAIHFKAFCRFGNEHWFEYDGLENPQCCFKGDLDKSDLYGANFFAYINSEYFSGVPQEGHYEIDLVDLSDDESETFDPPPSNVVEEVYDHEKFLEFMKENEILIKTLFEAESKKPTDNCFDQNNDKYDKFEDAMSNLITFCTKSKVLNQIPLTTRANKIIDVFNRFMDEFFKKKD